MVLNPTKRNSNEENRPVGTIYSKGMRGLNTGTGVRVSVTRLVGQMVWVNRKKTSSPVIRFIRKTWQRPPVSYSETSIEYKLCNEILAQFLRLSILQNSKVSTLSLPGFFNVEKSSVRLVVSTLSLDLEQSGQEKCSVDTGLDLTGRTLGDWCTLIILI